MSDYEVPLLHSLEVFVRRAAVVHPATSPGSGPAAAAAAAAATAGLCVVFRFLDFPMVAVRCPDFEAQRRRGCESAGTGGGTLATGTAVYNFNCGKSCLFRLSSAALKEKMTAVDQMPALMVLLVDSSLASVQVQSSGTASRAQSVPDKAIIGMMSIDAYPRLYPNPMKKDWEASWSGECPLTDSEGNQVAAIDLSLKLSILAGQVLKRSRPRNPAAHHEISAR
ncbi:hypothetical protein Pelo_13802 [Pelomyxa schiedti]|nr:hypothetical protein Pelo_13802 [Pelomyxa schiedti]